MCGVLNACVCGHSGVNDKGLTNDLLLNFNDGFLPRQNRGISQLGLDLLWLVKSRGFTPCWQVKILSFQVMQGINGLLMG